MSTSEQAPELKQSVDKLLACVHCGFCLSACPTYTRLGDESDSPRGRIYLMRAVMEGRLPADDPAFDLHIDQCLGCRACEPVCPSGVEYGFLVERARATLAKSVGISWPARLLLFAFGNDLARSIVSPLSRLFRWTGLPRLLIRALPARLGRLRFALAMLEATRPVRLSPRATTGSAPTARSSLPEIRVAMLEGCVQDGLFGQVNAATTFVLERNGCTVVPAAGQGCCGALHAHTGALDQARALARRNIAAFEASRAETIVVNAAGCGAMMKEYHELLRDEPEWRARAHACALKVRDISEFLVARGPVPGAPIRARVTYDAPCHLLHGQRITHAPLDVLRVIPELDLVPLPRADECCGGAGIYGLLHEELGGRILRDKVAAVRSTGADLVLTPNPGCIMQIGAGLLLTDQHTRALHPIELLAESYRTS
ncbi:MAG: (Fe-S)-binding protein [Longimicrobiales bacterium]